MAIQPEPQWPLHEGAVFQTYTLSELDIEETICVQVTAENCVGVVSSPFVGPVKKAEQAMPEAPQMESNTETSITLVAVEGCEYNIDGGGIAARNVFCDFGRRNAENRGGITAIPAVLSP